MHARVRVASAPLRKADLTGAGVACGPNHCLSGRLEISRIANTAPLWTNRSAAPESRSITRAARGWRCGHTHLRLQRADARGVDRAIQATRFLELDNCDDEDGHGAEADQCDGETLMWCDDLKSQEVLASPIIAT